MKVAKLLTLLAFIQCVQLTHAMDRPQESEQTTNNNNQNETPTNTQPQQPLSELSEASKERSASPEIDVRALMHSLQDDRDREPSAFNLEFHLAVDEMKSRSNSAYPLEDIPTLEQMLDSFEPRADTQREAR